MRSSLHALSEEEADAICNPEALIVENYLNMWTDRQESQKHYREAVAKDQAQSQLQFRATQRDLDRATQRDLADGKGGRKGFGKGTGCLIGGNATAFGGQRDSRSRPGHAAVIVLEIKPFSFSFSVSRQRAAGHT